MKTTLAAVVAALCAAAVAADAAPVAGRTPSLLWEQVYAGTAPGGFNWAHRLSLDASDAMIYATGKSSETFGTQSLGVAWSQGFNVAAGQTAWNVDKTTGLLSGVGGSYLSVVAEEMGVAIERWGGGNLLKTGRFHGTPSSRRWTGDRRILSPTGDVMATAHIPAAATRSSGFSPPVRGLGVALQSAAVGGWVSGFQTSAITESLGYTALDYVFSKFTTAAGAGISYAFNPLVVTSNWAGDCCYDPPSRTAIDASGNIYSLGGSIYDATTGSYGFLVLKVNISTPSPGGLTSWTYQGTAPNGRSVADALVAAADGSSVFVLAKTSETGRGFAARLMAFDASGSLRWLKDLSTDSGPMYDAVLAMSPLGTLRVVESQSGKVLTFDAAGNSPGVPLQLPLSAGSTYYIGSAVADDNGNLFVSGSKNNAAWVADYNNLIQPAAPECSILAAYNYPNPFDSRSGQTTIRYELFADADARVAIYDQVGAKVREWSFAKGAAGGAAGVNEFSWDGTTNGGRKVLRGVYIGRVSVSPDACETIFRIGVKH
ncbi:MAG: FlgD immunoglobulin-like domain containing protein [Elusimicrobiota bacterium]